MTRVGFAAGVFAIVAVATWAYNVNYETKTALGRIEELRARIAAEREHIQVLEVEWAWLNNPDRLARLAAAHADRLGLAPMSPETFAREAVPLPPEPEPAPPPVAGRDAPRQAALVAGLAAEPRDGLTPLPLPRPPARGRK